MDPFILLCGNGLTIDRVQQTGVTLDPSQPFGWEVPHPDGDGQLLEYLPALERWLNENREGADDYSLMHRLVTEPEAPVLPALDPNFNGPEDSDVADIHWQLRHYLAIAYSWFQVKLDTEPTDSWQWQHWLSNNRHQIQGVFSLNYDLVLERLLQRNRIRFYYPASRRGGMDGNIPVFGGGGIDERLNPGPIPVVKPHGSSNFASHMRITPAGEELTYPPPFNTWGVDAPLRVLSKSELMTIREHVEIITPGEWNQLDGVVRWVDEGKEHFRESALEARCLLVVGCSYYPPDRPELDDLLSRLPPLEAVVVCDPAPNEEFIEVLEEVAPVRIAESPHDVDDTG